jgi:WD40 repeat protein
MNRKHSFPVYAESVSQLAFLPDSKYLVALGTEGSLLKWDLSAGRLQSHLDIGLFSATATFLHKGKTLVTRRNGRNPLFWDVSDLRAVKQLPRSSLAKHACQEIVFSSDEQTIAVADRKAPDPVTISVYELMANKSIMRVDGFSNDVMRLSFSKDGKQLGVGYKYPGRGHNMVQVWDVKSNKEIASFPEETISVHSLAFSTDGRCLCTGDYTGNLRVWDISRRKLLVSIKAHTHSIVDLVFSSDGKTLFSTSLDNHIKCWSSAQLFAFK